MNKHIVGYRALLVVLMLVVSFAQVGCIPFLKDPNKEVEPGTMITYDKSWDFPKYIDSTKLIPYSFHFDWAYEKGLIGEKDVEGRDLTEKYYLLQAVYKYYFNVYLNETVGFDDYDEALATSSEYIFRPQEEDRLTVYQRYGSFDRQFIYLRNNFHIELLSSDDLVLLTDAAQRPPTADDRQMFEMVTRTWKEVITVSYGEDTERRFETIYDTGAFTGGRGIPNTALVLCLQTRQNYDETGNSDNDIERVKEDYLYEQFSVQMESELSQKLGVEVIVMVYVY
ncbi:MAG: hypothetical protein LBS58_00115 [Coriobacteriales bacterium]|jgi:hypothetical protein|nr:hypothetical protein [Coriobacteriales bacterium]